MSIYMDIHPHIRVIIAISAQHWWQNLDKSVHKYVRKGQAQDTRQRTVHMVTEIMFSQAIDEFAFDMQAMRRSRHTISDYKTAYQHWLRIMGDAPLCKISYRDVKRFLHDISKEEIAPKGIAPRPSKKRSAKTIKNYHIALSALWSWAINEGYASDHVVRKISPPKANKKPINPFTDAEIVALTKACKLSRAWHNKPLSQSRRLTATRDLAIILILLDTGLRNTELRNLTIDDINWKTNSLKVCHGKGDKDRFVGFGYECRRALRRWMLDRPEQAKLRGNWLFCNVLRYKGHKMSRGALSKLLKRIGEVAGVDDCHPHRFRHTTAVRRLQAGLNVFQVKEMLGHASLETTMQYVHIAGLDMQDAMARTSPVDNLKL